MTGAAGDRVAMSPDPPNFRATLGFFATGVAIVTAVDRDQPVGVACNSFASVSLEPPLVLFCAAKSSGTWPRIRAAGTWAANFVRDDGEGVTRLFAAKGTERFTSIGWRPGRTGAPILDDALAYVDCETFAEHDAGDHVIVVGRVLEVGHANSGSPLLFYRGGYGHFEP